MKKYFLLYIIMLCGVISPQSIKEKAEEMISSAFAVPVTFTSQKYIIPSDIKSSAEKGAKQRFSSESVYIYKILTGSKLHAYAFIDNVNGKAMPITFLVILDTAGKIISTGIIKYREAYGGAVQNTSWNEQFTGKDGKDSFKIGDDINGISGATISANSVTAGIKKIVLLFNQIKNKI